MTEAVKKELSQICQIIADTVDTEKIYLFGSHAYGTPNQDSDYDLCVIIPDHSIRPVDAIRNIYRALFHVQVTPIDVIAYRSSDFQERSKQASLERKIMREGVLLHECRKQGMA